MNETWLSVGVPAAVACFTALYTTGGRAALARRAMRQELEIASQMSSGPERSALERVAHDKALLYGARWVGPDPLNARQHLLLAAGVGLGIGCAWLTALLLPLVGDDSILSSVLLLFWTVGGALAAMTLTSWVLMTVNSEIARSRAETLDERRERITRRLGDGSGTPAHPRAA